MSSRKVIIHINKIKPEQNTKSSCASQTAKDELPSNNIIETEYDSRRRYRDWVFTLNNYQEDDINKIQTLPTQYQVFGKEIAPTTGTKHLQGYIYLKDAKTKRAVIALFKQSNISNEVYVSPRFRLSTPEQASNYCKKDKPITDIYEQGIIPNNDIRIQGNQGIWEQYKQSVKDGLSWEQLIEQYPSIVGRYKPGAKSLYEALRPKLKFNLNEEYNQLRPFQQTIINYIKQVPDKRKILWIVDKMGNSGKSELADHLMDNYNFIAINNGKTADMAYIWSGENIVMDLSRTQQDHINYEAIEQLKNGRIMSSKYESCIKKYNRPHFIVMANYDPNLKSMSPDRWDIKYINEQYELVDENPFGEIIEIEPEIPQPITRAETPNLENHTEYIDPINGGLIYQEFIKQYNQIKQH